MIHRMEDGRIVRCPLCKGKDTWSTGYVPTRQGRKPRYQCTECGHKFYLTLRRHTKAVSIKPSDFVDDEQAKTTKKKGGSK